MTNPWRPVHHPDLLGLQKFTRRNRTAVLSAAAVGPRRTGFRVPELPQGRRTGQAEKLAEEQLQDGCRTTAAGQNDGPQLAQEQKRLAEGQEPERALHSRSRGRWRTGGEGHRLPGGGLSQPRSGAECLAPITVTCWARPTSVETETLGEPVLQAKLLGAIGKTYFWAWPGPGSTGGHDPEII